MKHPSRIDQFPMRRVSPGILTEKPALHEIREADPAESETPTRRVGSVRQAQYTSAAGFAAPGSSYWQLDTNALDVSGQTNGFTIAFQVALGSIQEAAGKIYLIEGQQRANFAAKDANNTFKIWAEKASGAYTIKANIYNSSGAAGLTGGNALSIATTPDTNIKVALRVAGPMSGTPEVTLYVDASDDDGTLASGTYTMDECTLSILGPTASPEGTITVIDPINIFKNVDPTSEADLAMASRSPTTTPQIQLNCDSKAPISPATGSGDALPYPSKPLLDGGELRFNGLSGAVRVPFNSVFDRFFTSNLSSVASNVFAFKVTFSREFLTESRTTTLFEFPGFAKLELEADTGELLFTYSEQTRWETGSDFHSALRTETTVWVGCDGTNLFIYDGTDTATTSLLAGTELPFIDHRRIPDLFIGADEDKENDTNFHGSLLGFSIFDYAATSDDGEAIFDLQHRSDSVEDVSAFNIALALETHAPTSALPSIAPGPVQDADHKAILAGEVLVPAGVIGATSTLKAEDGIFSKAATGLKLGDKLFLNEPDGALCVADVRRNKLRPLGLPEIGQEVSARNIRSRGILDGVYQYGARFASGDGTYGPIRRLKPVKALGGTKVILGTTKEGDEDSGKTELGTSYGLTHDGVVNYFLFEDDDKSDSNVHGNSVEVFAAFPGFNDYKESVFDRYSQNRTTSSKKGAWVAYQAGLELDVTKDFTIGFSFRFSTSTLTDSVTHTQCLFSVGPNDLDPYIPAFQVMLYKGVGWGNNTDFRLAVARSSNRHQKKGDYRIGTIDDGSGGDFTWTNNEKYTVVVVRKGNALTIHVNDEGNNVWYSYDTLPSEATDGQALDSFFNSNNGGYDAAQRLLHWGSSGFGEEGGADANHMDLFFDGVNVTGEHGNHTHTDADPYVGGLSSSTRWYHARAWETAVSKDAIKTHFETRFATKTEPGFDHGLVSDVAFITDDLYDKPDQFWDRAAKLYWNCYEGDNLTTKVKNPTRTYFNQTKTLGDVQYALMVTDTDETDVEDAEIQLYASPLGDGSVTLSTGEESFSIVSELWNPFSERVITFDELKLGGLNVDAENFNWYTISTVMTTVGSNFDITLKDYALNGQEIMAFSMDSPKTNTLEKAKFIIYLGGFKSVTNTADTWIGELRWWQGNRYNNDYENYDYLDTRARQDSNEELNLHYFAKFQPFDENDPVDDTFKNWGINSGNFEKKGPGGSWSTPNPEIFDARTIDDEDIDDPAPAVAFPDAAYPYITAIELFRTKRIGISDERDEQEITKALTNVEGNPLRFLARIPIGEASFIDNIPQDTLGNAISESSGFVPSRPDGIFTWDDRLGVFKDGIISLGAQGPFGWESFESASQYHVPNQGLSDIIAAIPYANSLAVFGADWGTILTGSSESPRPYYLGGVGAQSARAVTTYAGSVYVLGDGALWRVTPPSGLSAPAAEDFGAPIIDKLPANGRLSVSSINASLYVINEDTGETLRFYFPSQRWTIEDRDALSVGDLSSGFGVVHLGSGSYSLKNSTIVGDDLNANTDESSTGSLSGNTLTMTNPNAPTGTRVLVVDSEGASIYTTVTGYTGGALTTTDSLVSLEDGAVDVELGIGEEGFLYDTGWYENPGGHDISQSTLKTGILSGTGFQIALDGDSVPGSRTASSSTFIDIGALADVRHQGASRGRWIRARIRNRKAEAAKLDRINLMHDLEQ